MCIVKTGEAVTTLSDLQNLITGMIFRQILDFSHQELFEIVMGKLVGSEWYEEQVVSEMVGKTLHSFVCNSWLHVKKNRYLNTYFPQIE